MPSNSLAQKLKLKPGARAALVNPPAGYLEVLGPLPAGVELLDRLEGAFDWVQVFVRSQADLAALAPHLPAALKPGALLWLSYPKGTSTIQTDLTHDRGWEPLRGSDLKWLNLVSVDESWSAFSLRPFAPGEAHQSFR